MSGYAINEFGGCRSVNSEADIEKGETFSQDFPEQSEPVKTREQVEMDRLFAYAHPVTGSDRLKTESDAEALRGNTAGAEAAQAAWLARREEIAKQNPWPKGKTK